MSAHSFLCVCACLLLGVVTSGVSLWGSLPLTQKHTHTHTPVHTCTHTMACGFFRCSFWARAIVDAYPAFRFCNGHWVHPLHTHAHTHKCTHTHFLTLTSALLCPYTKIPPPPTHTYTPLVWMALGHRQSFHSKLTLINNLLWTSAKPTVLPTAGFQYHACLNTLATGQLCVHVCVCTCVCMYVQLLPLHEFTRASEHVWMCFWPRVYVLKEIFVHEF